MEMINFPAATTSFYAANILPGDGPEPLDADYEVGPAPTATDGLMRIMVEAPCADQNAASEETYRFVAPYVDAWTESTNVGDMLHVQGGAVRWDERSRRDPQAQRDHTGPTLFKFTFAPGQWRRFYVESWPAQVKQDGNADD